MPPPLPPVPVAVVAAVVPALVVAVVVDADADVDVMPFGPVLLVTVESSSFVAGGGEEKMQAAVSPDAANANAKPTAEGASNLMRKPWRVGST